MANQPAQTSVKLATPTLEQFRGGKHYNTVVGTTVTQVPATNLNYRKGVIIQNKHATNVVYIGMGIPYLIEGRSHAGEVYSDADHDKRNLVWRVSGFGTNEWYLTTKDGDDPELSEITYLYYRVDGAEILATAGAAGSLGAQHVWDWGSNETPALGFDTLYIQSNGKAEANDPTKIYSLLLGYSFVLTADDTSETGGMEIGPRDTMEVTFDGSVKIFAIASGSDTPVGTLEVL